MVVGIAVLATNLVAALWGAIGWARKDARASIVFWPLQQRFERVRRAAGRRGLVAQQLDELGSE